MNTRSPRILCFMVHREKRFDITARRFERSWTSTFDLVPFTPGSFFSSLPHLLSSLYLSPAYLSISGSFHTNFPCQRWRSNLQDGSFSMGPWNGRFARETKCGERNGSSIIRRMSNWNILMNVCILNNGTGQNTRQKRWNRVVGMN